MNIIGWAEKPVVLTALVARPCPFPRLRCSAVVDAPRAVLMGSFASCHDPHVRRRKR